MATTTTTRTRREQRKHESVEERRARGKSLRKEVPRSSHAEWDPGPDRFGPVEVIEEQNHNRLSFLIPVRRGRMVVSPFTFYRGAARIMASDLASTPVTGLDVQACGDAHLSNFGLFASPERQLVFDINDFDETLAGPWEWDVKRLAASFVIAGQHLELEPSKIRELTTQVVREYRNAMAKFAEMHTVDVWYAHLPIEELYDLRKSQMGKKRRKKTEKLMKKARSKDSLQALSKLTEEVAGEYRVKYDPPLLIPFRRIPLEVLPGVAPDIIEQSFANYKTSLAHNRRHLLGRFTPIDGALKVVGVGSAGTRCAVLLLEGRDRNDPLFLQIKEAGRSVLEEHLPNSRYKNHGERVVRGQRLTQAVSDIFLGWTKSPVSGFHFYWRQLRDWKGSFEVEQADTDALRKYGHLCGWTLARAHARTGDPIALAAYLGSGDIFDRAVTEFAERYAEQNKSDYERFKAEIDSGRLEADTEN